MTHPNNDSEATFESFEHLFFFSRLRLVLVFKRDFKNSENGRDW